MANQYIGIGIFVAVFFAGFAGGYVVSEQTYSPKNLMAKDPQTTRQWMSTMFGTMMNDQDLRNEMMTMMMEDPEMMQAMMQNQRMMDMFDDGNVNSKSIQMGMNMFMPRHLTIAPNTTVTWITHDMEIHNVYGIFKTDSGNEISVLSGDIPPMKKWSYTFDKPGVFEYACGYHENQGMKGRIIVSVT